MFRPHRTTSQAQLMLGLALLCIAFAACASQDGIRRSSAPLESPGTSVGSPEANLPQHITRLTHFGERADWSHDGSRILFVEKTFGDVYEMELATGAIRLLTRHFYHEGFLRAMYLSNGDILLFGPQEFDPDDPYKSRWRESQLWVMDKGLGSAPVPLGTEVFEGAAVSRTRLRIVWMIGHADYYDTDDLLEPRNLPEGVGQFWMADVDYSTGQPRLANKKLVLDSRDLPFEADIEPQNFRRPDERELIFAAYRYNGIAEMGTNAEVIGLDLETGAVKNYTNSPLYEEPEGIFPDGRRTLVESDCHRGGGDKNIDLYDLPLDGSGSMTRLTFFNDSPGFKASNPVVSDDGRFIAFQMARSADLPGVGHGLFLFDFSGAKTEPVPAECVAGAQGNLETMDAIIVEEAARHPEMQVQDLYKFLHQAALGSEHAVDDVAVAHAWMTREVSALGAPRGEALIDTLSPDAALGRVNLRPFLAQGGDVDDLVEAFVDTANNYSGSSGRLEAYLARAIGLADSGALDLDPVAMQAFFDARAEEGYPALHHTEAYEAAYAPAYRVVELRRLARP